MAAPGVQGATITQAFDVDVDAAGPDFEIEQLLVFDRFNRNLGTLNQITVQYTARVDNGASMSLAPGLEPPNPLSFDYDLTAQVVVGFLNTLGSDFEILEGAGPSSSDSFQLAAGGTFSTPLIFGVVEALGLGAIELDRLDPRWDDILDAFSSAGPGTFNARVDGRGTLDVSNPQFLTITGLAGIGVAGSLTVDFAYTPRDLPDDGGGGPGGGRVPGPASLVLFGAAALGWVAARLLPRMVLISLVVCLPVSSPVWAVPVSDLALGSQLVGGVVTVTRFGGALNSATFVAAGTGASATAPGSEGFALTLSPGDTALATWTLTNTDLAPVFLNNITAVSIDLTLSGISLFDSGSEPSTPDSGPGIPGVIYVAGVPISSATDLLPWPDPANLGDMFRAVSISFSGPIGPGATSSWTDDTDVTTAVPEPTSIVLIGTGLLLLIRRCRINVMAALRRHTHVQISDCLRPEVAIQRLEGSGSICFHGAGRRSSLMYSNLAPAGGQSLAPRLLDPAPFESALTLRRPSRPRRTGCDPVHRVARRRGHPRGAPLCRATGIGSVRRRCARRPPGCPR
jgi:hypothetical protein